MFEFRFHPKPAQEAPARRRWGWASVGALVGVVALAVAGWATTSMEVDEAFDRVERGVKTALTTLTYPPADLAAAKSELQRSVRRWDREAARLQAMSRPSARSSWTPEQAERHLLTQIALERVRADGQKWTARLRAATPLTGEEIWTGIVVDVLTELARWPLSAVKRPPPMARPQALGKQFLTGLGLGAAGPLHMARSAFLGTRTPYGLVRRVLFPYNKKSGFRPLHLLGFGLATLAVGYGFCWVGMRFNRAWASYVGLAWFAHAWLFGAGLIGLRIGVLS